METTTSVFLFFSSWPFVSFVDESYGNGISWIVLLPPRPWSAGPGGHGISVADASQAIREFQRDFTVEFDVIEVTGGVISDAMRLAERHALRGYDAVQLSAALAVSAAAQSIGSDLDLNSAAAVEGLAVQDPNDHP